MDEGKCYIYQINPNQALLHKDKGTLSQLLGFSDDEITTAEDETEQVLLNISLYRNHRLGPSLNAKNWELVEKSIVGFMLHKWFGDKRQNLFTIGHDMSSTSMDTKHCQAKNNSKPPLILCTVLNEARYINIPTATIAAAAAAATATATAVATATATESTTETMETNSSNNNNGGRPI